MIGLLLLLLVTVNRDDLLFSDSDYEEEIETRDSLSEENGVSIVRLEPRDQSMAGIEFLALTPTYHQSGYELFGEVLDVAGLLDIRAQLIALLNADQTKAVEEAHLAESHKNARLLYEDRQSISRRELLDIEYQLKAVRTYRSNIQRDLSSLRQTSITKWGSTISEWLLNEYSKNFKNLANQNASLLRVFIKEASLAELDISEIEVAPVASPHLKIAGRYVGDAPNVKLGTGGVDKFFITESKIPEGTRIVASLSVSLKDAAGVLVPAEAVIWHSGKPWVFKQLSDGVFARVEIEATVDLGIGWFEVEALSPGDQIVVSGAQLLLSEELKYQIRNENED